MDAQLFDGKDPYPGETNQTGVSAMTTPNPNAALAEAQKEQGLERPNHGSRTQRFPRLDEMDGEKQ
jgi:hypothetical protein